MVTINPPNKSIDTTGLANIYRGFPDGDYDEADACDWVLSNAEAILNTHDALRNLVAAAGPIETEGRVIIVIDRDPFNGLKFVRELRAAVIAAKEVLK